MHSGGLADQEILKGARAAQCISPVVIYRNLTQ